MSADGPGGDMHEEKCGGDGQKPAQFILRRGSPRQSCLRRPARNDHSRSPEFCLISFMSKCCLLIADVPLTPKSIYAKFGVRNRSALAALWLGKLR
jgi:hypothetical protein